MKYEDFPQSYRDDVAERFEHEPEFLDVHIEEQLEIVAEDAVYTDLPIRHFEMDKHAFINGKEAWRFQLHYVHEGQDGYYRQWADVFGDLKIYSEDDDLGERWNWCVENLKGSWSVNAYHPHQSDICYDLLIEDFDDALRYKLQWEGA